MNESNNQNLDLNSLSSSEKDALLEMSFRRAPEILTQLKEDIRSGEIGAVIGVDSSGRLPALLISKVIKNAYKKLNHPEIQTLFVRGYPGNADSLALELKNNLPDKQRTVLVVDDTLVMGFSIDILMRILRKTGYKTKIAVFGLEIKEATLSIRKKQFGPIISGGPGTPGIYGKGFIAGVKKEIEDEENHAYPITNDFPHKAKIRIRKSIAVTRSYINDAAERLAKEIILDSDN